MYNNMYKEQRLKGKAIICDDDKDPNPLVCSNQTTTLYNQKTTDKVGVWQSLAGTQSIQNKRHTAFLYIKRKIH